MIHRLYFPLTKMAKSGMVKGEKEIALQSLVKLARGLMDFQMLVDLVAGATGTDPSTMQRMLISPSGGPSQLLTEAQEYKALVDSKGDLSEYEGLYTPAVYDLLKKKGALDYLDKLYPGVNYGLYNAAYGGASKGISNSWRSEYSDNVPGIRGAAPDDIVQAMLFGGVPLPGMKWDNTQKKYKERPPLYPLDQNIMTALGTNKPNISRLKRQLAKAAERTALKWVMSVDKGYRGTFLGNEQIPDMYAEPDPLTPEQLLEFEGWLELTLPKAKFHLRNSPGQLRLLEVVLAMKDKKKDPIIYKGGKKPALGLKINAVRKFMMDNGMVGPSGKVPSAPRLAKSWKGVQVALVKGFEEAFSVVQQDLLRQEENAEYRAKNKHDIAERIERQKTLRTQIIEDMIENQRRRRKSAKNENEMSELVKTLESALNLPQPERSKVSKAITRRISALVMAQSVRIDPFKDLKS